MSTYQRFVDYFVISGLDIQQGLEPDQFAGDSLHCSPLDRPYKSHVLAHYPDSVPGNPFDAQAVCMLCHPSGLRFCTQNDDTKASWFHSFMITKEDGSRIHGATLTFYEKVDNTLICSAMQTLQDMHQAELLNAQTRVLYPSSHISPSHQASHAHHRSPARRRSDQSVREGPRSSNSLPRLGGRHSTSGVERGFEGSLDRSGVIRRRQEGSLSPRTRRHIEMFSVQPEITRNYKLSSDVLYATKSICLLSRLPLVDAHEQYMRSLHSLVFPDENTVLNIKQELSISCYIYNLLYETPLPPPGRSLRIIAPGGGEIVCQRPDVTELPLLDYPIRRLLDLIDIDGILAIFTCILLEHQILFCSTDCERLMLVSEVLTSLIFPFQWQHVYVPILPSSLHHFLDAPVPFIMGLQGSNVDAYAKASVCVVDIDAGIVDPPEDLPEFPYIKELKQDLEQEIRRCRALLFEDGGAGRGAGSDDMATHQRDSGFCRDSFIGSENGATGSWSLSAKMEMLQQNEALARITALARKTGVVVDDIRDSVTDAAINASQSRLTGVTQAVTQSGPSPLTPHTRELMFNCAIRELFLHYLLHIFSTYESFVVTPPLGPGAGPDERAELVEAWLSGRSESQSNFDKTAFLSDHAAAHLHFLSPFTETQMFTSFVDAKILSGLCGGGGLEGLGGGMNEEVGRVSVFDSRLRVLNEEQQTTEQRLRRFYRTGPAKAAEAAIERRATSLDDTSALPHPLEEPVTNDNQPGVFPILPAASLNKEPTKTKQMYKKFHAKYGIPGRATDKEFTLRDEVTRNKVVPTRQTNLDMNPKAMVNTNWKFMETLLKECKVKTKRMLLQKMGQEAVDLGHWGEATVGGVEENMLIAGLCDLLVRIWSHGLQQKQKGSALWFHLISFEAADHVERENRQQETLRRRKQQQMLLRQQQQQQQQQQQYHQNQQQQQQYLAPGNDMTLDGRGVGGGLEVGGEGGEEEEGGLHTWPLRQHRRKPSRGPEPPVLEPLAVSLLADVRSVRRMSDIRTDVGYARAFVRLALEKKLLSRHLKELLANADLLRTLYKRYAFLRCEEEREQFLFHLLSLNAVDYHCFTNTFTSTTIPYRVLIFPRMKTSGGSTTANCWVSLAGHLCETDQIPLPKHTLDITVQHKNLGVLTTMCIGHDNAGLAPKWMVEHVLVRNEMTGETYRFPCGRWLGRGADDGALERLLVAELVPPTVDANELVERCRTPPRCRSPSVPRRASENRVMTSDVQERLRDSVINLLKHLEKCRVDKERGSVTGLLCGEGGLVNSLEQVFQFGFKSARLFRGRFFIWDFLERVVQQYTEPSMERHRCDSAQDRVSLCRVVSSINHASDSIGKDERFQIFICLGLRDKCLQRWLRLIGGASVTMNMYEEHSFLRNPTLMELIIRLLDPLNEFNINLESSLTRGVRM